MPKKKKEPRLVIRWAFKTYADAQKAHRNLVSPDYGQMACSFGTRSTDPKKGGLDDQAEGFDLSDEGARLWTKAIKTKHGGFFVLEYSADGESVLATRESSAKMWGVPLKTVEAWYSPAFFGDDLGISTYNPDTGKAEVGEAYAWGQEEKPLGAALGAVVGLDKKPKKKEISQRSAARAIYLLSGIVSSLRDLDIQTDDLQDAINFLKKH